MSLFKSKAQKQTEHARKNAESKVVSPPGRAAHGVAHRHRPRIPRDGSLNIPRIRGNPARRARLCSDQVDHRPSARFRAA